MLISVLLFSCCTAMRFFRPQSNAIVPWFPYFHVHLLCIFLSRALVLYLYVWWTFITPQCRPASSSPYYKSSRNYALDGCFLFHYVNIIFFLSQMVVLILFSIEVSVFWKRAGCVLRLSQRLRIQDSDSLCFNDEFLYFERLGMKGFFSYITMAFDLGMDSVHICFMSLLLSHFFSVSFSLTFC